MMVQRMVIRGCRSKDDGTGPALDGWIHQIMTRGCLIWSWLMCLEDDPQKVKTLDLVNIRGKNA